MSEEAGTWGAYVPQMAANWVVQDPEKSWRSVDGSLVFVDISGFTSLSERLAGRGRIGAEELTGVLDRVFARMLEIAYVRGGYLLKFGGDALLLFFDGDDHVLQSCAAVVEMRRALRDASKEQTSVGRINLKMSSGVHSGQVDFFLVGESHRELVVTGPAASVTTEMEGAADAGEIVISEAVAAGLPPSFVGAAKGGGWLLRKREIDHPPSGRPADDAAPQPDDLARLVPTALRDHLGSGPVEPEHRLATIGFLKFKGVDALLTRSGAEATASELDRLFRHVQRAISDEGVSYLASDIDADGGKIILATGVPRSRHDDEGRMLRALRRIVDVELDLELRAGVNRGHVFAGNIGTPFRSSYTVMGDTVNLAARLMAAARPGELYAAPSVLNLSSTLFETTALPPFEVKGKSQPVHAFSVGEESGVRPPVLTTVLPFQGREAETEMLVGVVNTCSRVGRGGMMTVTGDTGVGKSRLVAEALARCDGMDTLLIQAEPNGSENPYWAFRDPLRRFLGIERSSNDDMARRLEQAVDEMAPDLSWALPLLGRVVHVDIPDNDRTAAIDGRFRPQQTAEALVALLSSGYTKPVAMVAEDGQWLDEASTALLDMIGEAARERPWTVLVTARTSDEFTPLGDEIKLGPLDDDSVRAITIESTRATPLRAHELASIVSRSGGNPLFLHEILRVVAETGTAAELPESLDAVVSTEIDTLPALPRRLLRYSSVLGRRFRRQVLDEFLAPEAVTLDDATRRELERFIEEDGEGRVTFRHSVVHEIAYASLPFATRRELHGRAGRVIERQSHDDLDSVAEYLAAHFSQSGDAEKAFRYSILAAGRARDAYANTDAAMQYQRALNAARQLGEHQDHDVVDIWVALGEVRELAGHMEESREAYSRALAASRGDPRLRADICLRRAGTWMSSGNLAQAMRFVSMGRRALEDEGTNSHEGLLARLLAFESSIFMLKNAPSKARQAARRAGDLARAASEEEALARSYAVLDWANFMLGIEEPRHGPEAIETYQRLGLLERSVGVMNNMGAFAYLEGRWDEAIDWYRQSLEAAERSGNVLEAALTKANIAEVLIGQRKQDLASPMLAEARRTYEASRSDYYLPLVALLEGRAATAAGHPDQAIGVLEGLASQSGGAATPWIEEIEIALAEALLRNGEAEEALDRLSAPGIGVIDASAPGALRVRGMAIESLGRHDEALSSLRMALGAAEERGDQLEEALTLEALHETESRLGLTPEPASVDRLAELSAQLGLVTPQTV